VGHSHPPTIVTTPVTCYRHSSTLVATVITPHSLLPPLTYPDHHNSPAIAATTHKPLPPRLIYHSPTAFIIKNIHHSPTHPCHHHSPTPVTATHPPLSPPLTTSRRRQQPAHPPRHPARLHRGGLHPPQPLLHRLPRTAGKSPTFIQPHNSPPPRLPRLHCLIHD
jgi:hypothetical protein